jgi:hypothetical protein
MAYKEKRKVAELPWYFSIILSVKKILGIKIRFWGYFGIFAIIFTVGIVIWDEFPYYQSGTTVLAKVLADEAARSEVCEDCYQIRWEHGDLSTTYATILKKSAEGWMHDGYLLITYLPSNPEDFMIGTPYYLSNSFQKLILAWIIGFLGSIYFIVTGTAIERYEKSKSEIFMETS